MFDIAVDDVLLPTLESEICAWASRLAACTCAWLLGVAAFDRRQGWTGVGIRSCAHWLSWKCGVSLRTAAEQVRVARALETLPVLREAFAGGRLSYSKVRAVSRVASPDDESEWVRQATRSTAGQLDRLVTAWRSLHPDPDDTPDRRRDNRHCRWRWDDGDLLLHARLPPDQGALLVAAVDAARASLTTTDPPTPTGGPARSDNPTGTDNPTSTDKIGDLDDPDKIGDLDDPDSPTESLDDPTRPGTPTDAPADPPADPPAAAGPPDCDSGPAAALTAALRPVPRDRHGDADGLVALAEAFLSGGAPVLLDPARYTVTVHLDARLLDPRNHPDQHAPDRDERPHDDEPDTHDPEAREEDSDRHVPHDASHGRHPRHHEDSDLPHQRPTLRHDDHDPSHTHDDHDSGDSGDSGDSDDDHSGGGGEDTGCGRHDDHEHPRHDGQNPSDRTPDDDDHHHAPAGTAPQPETAPGPGTTPGPDADQAGPGILLPCCHLAPQVGLHPETARRLACDSVITTLLTSPGGDPLAVGRAHRTTPARLRKALYARDRQCTFPGCEHTRWLQAHHIEHWGHGGLTDLDNLTLVCSHHHHAVHEGGIRLRREADGTVVAVLPDGTLLHPAPPTTAGHNPLDQLRQHTAAAGPTTIVPRWWGDPLNLADSISAIIQAGVSHPKPASV